MANQNTTINVFELTQAKLQESVKPVKKTAKKSTVKESFIKGAKKRRIAKFPANRLQVESLRMFREDDEVADGAVADYTPEDDVVMVIDPEMEETPETAEDAVEAAEEMVGDYICKCAICGANYVCDHSAVTEDLEVEEDTCPVCGEEGEQIVVGEITPVEEVSADDDAELTDIEDEGDVDVDVDVDFDEDEDEDMGESVKRARHAVRRTESRKPVAHRRPTRKVEGKAMPRKAVKRTATRPVAQRSNDTMFEEVAFNRMLTRFVKENYSNVRSIRITKGSVAKKNLTLEGVVTTTKGNRMPIKFICNDFNKAQRMTLRFSEVGPFTESAKAKNKNAFVLECRMNKNVITPITLRYNYVAKEGKSLYSVSGKVLSESARVGRKPVQKTRRAK